MRYKKRWYAKCPRCGHNQSDSDFLCENCGKGHIRATEYNEDIKEIRGVIFGCNRCDASSFSPKICQKCGPSIQARQVETYSMTGIILFIAAIIAGIFLFAHK